MRSKLYLKLLIIGGAVMLSGCGGKQENNSQQQAPPFPVVKVESKKVTGYQTYPTSIEGIVNSAVRAKVSGYIKQVLVDEGQKVNKGQTLFRLETETLTQDADAAKASVNVAQVEVDRLKPLVEKGIISNVQLETAKANLAQAKSNYNSINANIGYATVKSPVDGYVGAIPFREGTLVSPSDQVPLTTVSDIKEVYAYFSMNEKDYLDFLQNTKGETLEEKIKNFPKVNLLLANGEQYKQKGEIKTVTGQINENTGTVSFRATFDNPNRLLTNGNSGKIQIPAVYTDLPVISQESTFERQGQVLVYHVNGDNKVSSEVIKIKDGVDNLYVVESGVKIGDVIVAKGVGKLRADMAITPQEVAYDSITKPIKKLFRN
ncbi:efflux RND transporter periplasmic adaptor subunit [Galbibacter pacificus]|uniref:Efflux RND transporter periplasmic adaptor subunit n=1 Tax=Galbibacter pacificus TaxID=2996052 RepID=A0ABT6FTS5_9FLAO|nr:efflux RND transporter periplasmic adaptor subunit [Galbibacter pacificus]MDG3583164.1 efflux RND transporter periplasmic adaptor subunit [Galbibacter pacificus]MDG3586645.1 efflux RND transporter periplasmic adaptor subunit [Galbibacter pacificus]